MVKINEKDFVRIRECKVLGDGFRLLVDGLEAVCICGKNPYTELLKKFDQNMVWISRKQSVK